MLKLDIIREAVLILDTGFPGNSGNVLEFEKWSSRSRKVQEFYNFAKEILEKFMNICLRCDIILFNEQLAS